MDKKTKKLLKHYVITEEDLQAETSSFSIDVSGAKNEILKNADCFDVSATPSSTKQISAGELITMAGSACSIIQLLESLIKQFGSNTQVTLIVGGIAIALTAAQAIENIIKEIAAKKSKTKMN